MNENEMVEEVVEKKAVRAVRSEWEVREDCDAVKRALSIFKDPERLEEVKEMLKQKRSDEKSVDALLDGDLKVALGL